MLRRLCLASLVLACCAVAPAIGAPVVTFDNQVGPGGAGSTFTPSYTVSGSDLINGRTPTASAGDFMAVEITGGLPVLTDGTYGTITEPGGAADRTHLAFAIAGGGSNTGTSVTYTLNTAASPLGYNLSQIDVYGGWNDNGRDQQLYDVEYSTVANPTTFVPLTSANFNPNIGANLQSATLSRITDTAGPLALGVHSVRFNFPGAVENGYAGYAEIDVIGTAVPEPASAGVLGLLAIGALARRRRR